MIVGATSAPPVGLRAGAFILAQAGLMTGRKACVSWFHKAELEARLSAVAHIYLLRGRVEFMDPRGNGQQTPFSLMVLTFGATVGQNARFAELQSGFWSVRERYGGTG